MSKFVIRHLALAMLALTLAAAPVASVVYAAPDANPPPPPPARSKLPVDNTTPSSVDDRGMPRPDKSKKKKSSEVRPSTQDTAFASGYRAAYATIYERHDYAAAIEQLKTLGHDDSAAVANLIGYSYRQLGDYKVSQIWYERALKADPNHVKTWQYYGLWQVEQGNRDQAQYHLNKIAALAGTSSEEYRSLAAALEKPPGTGLVY
jgi:tetratricopeptide (TPR) repeat protein